MILHGILRNPSNFNALPDTQITFVPDSAQSPEDYVTATSNTNGEFEVQLGAGYWTWDGDKFVQVTSGVDI